MTTLADVLLEAREVGRRAAGSDVWLLRDVNLTLRGGNRIGVSGPTGSGKTLLLRVLALLDPCDTGSVLWCGRPVRGADVPNFRSQAIYLHQHPALFEGSVADNLQAPFRLGVHRRRTFPEDEVERLLDQIDRPAAAFLSRATHDLSGGERQLVALLRALLLQPRVLLLDEPTAAMDGNVCEQVEQLVDQWFQAAPQSRGLFWVSHDPTQIARVANRVIEIRGGRIARHELSNPEALR